MDFENISAALCSPPFNKNISIIQLHDELTSIQLIDLVYQVSLYIDEAANPSVFSLVEMDQNEKIAKLVEFLEMLKFPPCNDYESCISLLTALDRSFLISILSFLLADLQVNKKRAYLSLFLAMPAIPVDFIQDDSIIAINKEILSHQEEFKESHKYLDELKQSGQSTTTIKKSIQKMEEEKQQISSKISSFEKRIKSIPNSDSLFKIAQNYRQEQIKDVDLQDKISEQKSLLLGAERKLEMITLTLKQVKENLSSSSAENVFLKIEEECRMNKFLATENLPKSIQVATTRLKDLKEIIKKNGLSDVEIGKIDKEISEANQLNSQLAEKTLKSSKTSDANLALFRQQASIIAAKKEATVLKLNTVLEELNMFQDKIKLQAQTGIKSGQKLLQGEDFQKYVSEIRGKSTIFKRKKQELDAFTLEWGILERTKEILSKKEQDLAEKLKSAEELHGIKGYHDTRQTLEKVSELKSEKDEEKAQQLTEISEIIQRLVDTINEKKTVLAPVIQELRSLRQVSQDLYSQHEDVKRNYDSTMYGIETDLDNIQNQVKLVEDDNNSLNQKLHHLGLLSQHTEIAYEKVMQEMKSYIGVDEMVELVQKSRGFKTYRDLYTRKITEAEHQNKQLKEKQEDVKSKHESNLKQLQMFCTIQQLLNAKIAVNKQLLSDGGKIEDKVGIVTQDRLVL